MAASRQRRRTCWLFCRPADTGSLAVRPAADAQLPTDSGFRAGAAGKERVVASVNAAAEPEGVVIPRDNEALHAPAGYMSLFRTLQEYLLRTEFHLWGVLDKGWASALPPSSPASARALNVVLQCSAACPCLPACQCI